MTGLSLICDLVADSIVDCALMKDCLCTRESIWNKFFQMAMKKIMKDERAVMVLGDKIKGFGDPNSRTRKRLEHQPYMVSFLPPFLVVFVDQSCLISLLVFNSSGAWRFLES